MDNPVKTSHGKQTVNDRAQDFIGQIFEFEDKKIKVKSVLGRGGFHKSVFIAEDLSNGEEYALKLLISDNAEANESIMNEIRIVKQLSGHPNIIQFFVAAFIENQNLGTTDYLLLTELCTGGPLLDALMKYGEPLPRALVVKIFYQICSAVKHMHIKNPPIIHRDLKVENLFIGKNGFIKLCDFGCATTKTYYPDCSWTALQHSVVKNEMCKNTTPMYRAPEILDTYENHPINQAIDIWALGCLLFVLCFNIFPFEDLEKIRLGRYIIPPSKEYETFHDLFRGIFQINPKDRPNILDVLERLEEISDALTIDLKCPINFEATPSSNQSSADETNPVGLEDENVQNVDIASPPWEKNETFNELFDLLYSTNTFDNERGIEIVQSWEKNFPDNPFAPSATSAITTAIMRDKFSQLDVLDVLKENEIKNLYTMGIARYVNVVDEICADLSIRKSHGRTAADALGFPAEHIDRRNESVHSKQRPSLEKLRDGAVKAKHWLRLNYWQKKSNILNLSTGSSIRAYLAKFYSIQKSLLFENLMTNVTNEKEEIENVLIKIQDELLINKNFFLDILISPDFLLHDCSEIGDFPCVGGKIPLALVNIWKPILRVVIEKNAQELLVKLLEYEHPMTESGKKIMEGWQSFLINEDSLYKNFYMYMPVNKWPIINWMRVIAACMKKTAFLLPETIEKFAQLDERKKSILTMVMDLKVCEKFPKESAGRPEDSDDGPHSKQIKTDLCEISDREGQKEYIIKIGNKSIDWAYTPLYEILIPK